MVEHWRRPLLLLLLLLLPLHHIASCLHAGVHVLMDLHCACMNPSVHPPPAHLHAALSSSTEAPLVKPSAHRLPYIVHRLYGMAAERYLPRLLARMCACTHIRMLKGSHKRAGAFSASCRLAASTRMPCPHLCNIIAVFTAPAAEERYAASPGFSALCLAAVRAHGARHVTRTTTTPPALALRECKARFTAVAFLPSITGTHCYHGYGSPLPKPAPCPRRLGLRPPPPPPTG